MTSKLPSPIILLFLAALTALAPATSVQAAAISVNLKRPFFNPSLGQKESVSIALPGPGKLTADIVDRDGFAIVSLARNRQVRTSNVSLTWDGRDQSGRIVPDESYSLKIDFVGVHGRLTYFPAAAAPVPPRSIPVRYFDPRTGVVAYTLPFPARVHMQAGSAVIGKDKQAHGPVLKTIVNREPRIAGEVLDHWDGFDESEAIYVPDLPHFVMSIAASPLPENSMIAVGNRSVVFLDYAAHRHGVSLLPQHQAGAHHVGLTTLDDVSPKLSLSPAASWSAAKRSWTAGSSPVRIALTLEGPNAARFAAHSQSILVFVDGQQVAAQRSTVPKARVRLPHLSAGTHTVAINWVGRDGPVAVNAFRLVTGAQVSSK